MKSNNYDINKLYDNFFLEKTFNSKQLRAAADLEVIWLINKLKLNVSNSILDVACGTGRHLSSFVSLGFLPFGVDMSHDCVKLAKKNCKKIKHQIFCQDFIEFYKQKKMKFDLVLLAGASFGYEKNKKDNLIYLKTLMSIVNDGGYVVIQFLNKKYFQKKFKTMSRFWNEDFEYYILDSRQVINNNLKSTKTFISKKNYKVRSYQDLVFLYTKNELQLEVKKNTKNINFISCNDDFNNNKVTARSAAPVIIFKKKK